MPIPFWAGHYIGLPYKSRGRDSAGLDCWGLVRLILHEQMDIQVPCYTAFYDSATNHEQIGPLVRRESLNWGRVREAEGRLGDVVVLRMRGQPMHVGFILDERHMLHIEQGINSVIERYDSLKWKKRITGIFRHQKNDR